MWFLKCFQGKQQTDMSDDHSLAARFERKVMAALECDPNYALNQQLDLVEKKGDLTVVLTGAGGTTGTLRLPVGELFVFSDIGKYGNLKKNPSDAMGAPNLQRAKYSIKVVYDKSDAVFGALKKVSDALDRAILEKIAHPDFDMPKSWAKQLVHLKKSKDYTIEAGVECLRNMLHYRAPLLHPQKASASYAEKNPDKVVFQYGADMKSDTYDVQATSVVMFRSKAPGIPPATDYADTDVYDLLKKEYDESADKDAFKWRYNALDMIDRYKKPVPSDLRDRILAMRPTLRCMLEVKMGFIRTRSSEDGVGANYAPRAQVYINGVQLMNSIEEIEKMCTGSERSWGFDAGEEPEAPLGEAGEGAKRARAEEEDAANEAEAEAKRPHVETEEEAA